MNPIRELIVQLPKLCGVERHERWSTVNALVFDHEAEEKKSAFARIDGESIRERLAPVFSFYNLVPIKYIHKAMYGMDLVIYAAMMVDNNNGRLIDANYIRSRLDGDAGTFPDIDEILTPAQASTLTFWNP